MEKVRHTCHFSLICWEKYNFNIHKASVQGSKAQDLPIAKTKIPQITKQNKQKESLNLSYKARTLYFQQLVSVLLPPIKGFWNPQTKEILAAKSTTHLAESDMNHKSRQRSQWVGGESKSTRRMLPKQAPTGVCEQTLAQTFITKFLNATLDSAPKIG